jgi:hypothetical protein
VSCSYDLQYRMELANHGMFFDDEEVAAMRGCGCCARSHLTPRVAGAEAQGCQR